MARNYYRPLWSRKLGRSQVGYPLLASLGLAPSSDGPESTLEARAMASGSASESSRRVSEAPSRSTDRLPPMSCAKSRSKVGGRQCHIRPEISA